MVVNNLKTKRRPQKKAANSIQRIPSSNRLNHLCKVRNYLGIHQLAKLQSTLAFFPSLSLFSCDSSIANSYCCGKCVFFLRFHSIGNFQDSLHRNETDREWRTREPIYLGLISIVANLLHLKFKQYASQPIVNERFDGRQLSLCMNRHIELIRQEYTLCKASLNDWYLLKAKHHRHNLHTKRTVESALARSHNHHSFGLLRCESY